MTHKVGIWIDHKKAVVVSASADGVTTKTLESEVEAHPRYTGQQDGGGEKKYEERHSQDLDRAPASGRRTSLDAADVVRDVSTTVEDSDGLVRTPEE